MKIMAIDYGAKRVGIASTDETGQFALPRAVWPNDKNLAEKTLHFIEEEGIEEVVMGESRNLDGSRNTVLTAIEEFKTVLESKGVRVILHPEVYTSVEARHIQGGGELTDASAAALILKSYIDTENNKK